MSTTPSPIRHAVIILAAGTGSRTGHKEPKQFWLLHGKPVLHWSLEVFCEHNTAFEVILVANPDWYEATRSICVGFPDIKIIVGGDNRTQSVANALKVLDGQNIDRVFIHDAARPGINLGIIDKLLEVSKTYQGVAPALPVRDALKRSNNGMLESIARDDLHQIQTPQLFHFDSIKTAYANYAHNRYSDDFELAEQANLKLGLISGALALHKITYREDFDLVSRLLSTRETITRIGQGFDVHAFGAGDHVWLCGVNIPHDMSLEGHSDADVGWHALCDALLGALALGDIGQHFPPSDQQWQNASSEIFLDHCASLVSAQGAEIVNVDITLICEAPRIGPYREAMQIMTSKVLQITPQQVSIKATTTEGLGYLGRKEGIAALAQAVVKV